MEMEVTGKISQWGNSLALRVNQKVADTLSVAAGSVRAAY
jgi:antitoxin component of MazEF toxin-antitoxin module